MKSCHTLLIEKLVIGVSHFWNVLMVCKDCIQHIENKHYIVYKDVDVLSVISDVLRLFNLSALKAYSRELGLRRLELGNEY